MDINKLKEIAKKNDYEFIIDENWLDKSIILKRKVRKDLYNFIMISLINKEHHMLYSNTACDMRDLDMLQAAIEFTKIPIKDR